jgi:hypothetical protein
MKASETTSDTPVKAQSQTAKSFFGLNTEAEAPFFASNSNDVVQSKPFFSPAISKNHTNPIQAKLTMGAPDDQYEQEADSVADKVVQRLAQSTGSEEQNITSKGQVTIQQKCDTCDQEEDLQRKENSAEAPASPDLASQLQSNKGSGNSLPNDTRTQMETAMGADFSGVRVHTGGEAAQMSQNIHAQAFTHGSDIYFNEGKYDTGSTDGQRLLAHELTHTVQQGGTNSIQRQIKPPGGSAPYLPNEKGLKDLLLPKTAEERKKFIEEFVLEIYPQWEVLKDDGYWDKIKGIEAIAKDQKVVDSLDPVPQNSKLKDANTGNKVKTQYSNLAVRFSITDSIQGENILEEQYKRNKKAITDVEYADMDNASIYINQYSKDPDQTTSAIKSLRGIQTVVNRFYAAYLASKEANMDYSLPEILAIYQQEGNKEMPSSSKSLEDKIPTGVTDSVSLVGTSPTDKIEISGGVLILNSNFAGIKSWSDERLKFLGLKIYFNHIGGLDIIHQNGTVKQLAKWSVDNLIALNKVKNSPANPTAETDALVAAESKWTKTRDNLKVIKKAKGYIFAPDDPVTFVKDILVETMIFLKRYSEIERVFDGTDTKGSTIPSSMPLSLTYMQFNSSSIDNKKRPKDLISSVLKAAKNYKGIDRFKLLREEAALIKKADDITEVKKWLLGEKPYESVNSDQRWEMVMDFIEHAGYEDWKANWAQMRGNASLVRTQAEFYAIVFN